MKLHKWFRALWAFLLSFGLSVAATMGITTAFGFYIDTASLIWCCGIAAFISSLFFTLHLDLVPLGAGVFALGYLLLRGYLLSSFEAILNRITRAYNQAYGWGIFRMSVRTAEEMEPDIVFMLCILGSLIALLVSFAVCRKKTSVFGLFFSLVTIVPCFVVNDYVPATGWLYLYFLCFIVLMLTGFVRKQKNDQDNRLYLITSPVIALILLILFAAIPKDTYNRQDQAEKLAEKFLNSEFVQLFLGHTESGADPTADGKTVDLTTVGYRMETHIQSLEVTAPYTGTLYLRGRAMDLYDGVTWTDSGNYYIALTWPGFHLDRVGEVKISTRFAHQMLYVPYYANITDMRNVTLGIPNETKLTDYSFTCRKLPAGNYLATLKFDHFDRYSLVQYIDLGSEVQQWAGPLARKLTADATTPYQAAQQIASYVRNSATYNTRTPRMPGSKDDFARWFLEDSDTGYCVHFATATTVLLQAAGIPARYVTGYAVQVVEGQEVVVYADQAHAWTEYWLPGFGWAVLDATPAEGAAPQETTSATENSENISQTEATVSPIGGADVPTMPEADRTEEMTFSFAGLVQVTLWAVVIAGVPLVIVWQRRLRLNKKKKQLSAAGVNEKALLYWQAVCRYCRLLKEEPDKALFRIAEKAKFSQHTLTEEELRQFEDKIALCEEKFNGKNLVLRLYYRYVLVLY